jgi:hypothetical protein
MATNDRQPVFVESFDGGKTYRIIDAETNQPACTPAGDYIDGGGYTEAGHFVAYCEATRINQFERGILDNTAQIRAAQSHRERQSHLASDTGVDECGRWLYEQWEIEHKTWAAIFAEYESARIARDWSKVSTANALRNRAARYAERCKLPFRKGIGGRRPK